MLASNRVFKAIVDQVLQLLPDDPADSKRLDDLVDRDDALNGGGETVNPVSGVQPKVRAAS